MARKNSYRGKYKLEKAEYLSAKYYALRYNEWLDEYNSLKDSVGAVQYDGMPHGASAGNPTENLGARRAELRRKMDIIEQTAAEADPVLHEYILLAAVNEDVTFHHLKTLRDIPCESDMFYDRRRRFYWLLSKKI